MSFVDPVKANSTAWKHIWPFRVVLIGDEMVRPSYFCFSQSPLWEEGDLREVILRS